MKIRVQNQCPECLGVGISPNKGMNDSNRMAIQNIHREYCSICKGQRIIEEWMDAAEFAKLYIHEKIEVKE